MPRLFVMTVVVVTICASAAIVAASSRMAHHAPAYTHLQR